LFKSLFRVNMIYFRLQSGYGMDGLGSVLGRSRSSTTLYTQNAVYNAVLWTRIKEGRADQGPVT
jgi:hypothetical protein